MNENIPGFVNQRKLNIIKKWVNTLPDNVNAIEVGTYCGLSAHTISKNLKKNSKLICIDNFSLPVKESAYQFVNMPVGYVGKNSKEHLMTYLKDCDNIEILVGNGDEFNLDNVMFVFIDDGHFNPSFRNNLRHWWSLLLDGGIICGDDFYEYDYENKKLDVIPEVLKLAKDFNLRIEIEEIYGK
jgi:hypothetical protein